MLRLSDVKNANKQWFAPGNKNFFGDVWYKIRKGKKSGKYYLIRKTSMWSDMFGESKTYYYRINPIEEDLKIGSLIDTVFNSEIDVNNFLELS